MQHKFSSTGWVLDKSSIFAQVDAFVQRCKDLLEVNLPLFYHLHLEFQSVVDHVL